MRRLVRDTTAKGGAPPTAWRSGDLRFRLPALSTFFSSRARRLITALAEAAARSGTGN